MRLLRSTASHVKNNCFSGCFLLCLVCTAAVSFFTIATMDEDTVFELIVSRFWGEEISGDGLSVLNLFLQSLGDNLEMLVPVLAAFPFVLPFTVKHRTGNVRFEMSRSGRTRFCVSHLMAAAATGGLVLSLGYLLYGVLLIPFFPLTVATDEAAAMSVLIGILRKLVGLFLYGGGSALFAYLLVFLSDNMYIILCLPFLINYIVGYLLDWLGTKFFAVYIPEMDMYFVDNPLMFVQTSYLQGAVWLTAAGLRSLAFYLVLALLLLLAARVILELRGDCCE